MSHKDKSRSRGRALQLRSSRSMPTISDAVTVTASTDEDSSTSSDLEAQLQRPMHHVNDTHPRRQHTLSTACVFRARPSAVHFLPTPNTAAAAADASLAPPRTSPTRMDQSLSFGTLSSESTAASSSKKNAKRKLRRSLFLILAVGAMTCALLTLLIGATLLQAHRQRRGSYTELRGTMTRDTLPGQSMMDLPFHGIPLPLPTQKVSVVLINYTRPRMIRESILMRTILAHPSIDELFLLHANPKTAFEFVHPKVVNIDATHHNDVMGLSLRFYFCQLAKNDWVIHVDDDMEFHLSALNEMLVEFGRNPKRIVGRFGRDLKPGSFFDGYNSGNTHKQTEVVLTKLMVMERAICPAFFDYAPVVWQDAVLSSGEGPLWNGEDIFMSLVANHVYAKPTSLGEENGARDFNNYAMDWLDVWQASDSLKDYSDGKLDISGGMSGIRLYDWKWWQTVFRRNRHYSYRGRLWQLAKNRLAMLEDSPRYEIIRSVRSLESRPLS